ncbi:hypothetical protein Nepgr_009141 [Nepenthes gracilis]|uniref:Glutamyl-tRNA(Gln) amidotransferase subunit C, chloroplastic/mitochondrial n=1 Tax=Nepenthes gracilis TaxID=150966 RepID=A0AAD3SAF6_NEPGR|nr:hypothetical protein Nepgr_009141 [Nepenthes gracilis]
MSSRVSIIFRGGAPLFTRSHGSCLSKFHLQWREKRSYSIKSSLEPPDVARLAETARISLTPQEVEKFGPKIQQVVEWFGQLQAVDLESVKPAIRAETEGDNLREDLPETFGNREAIIAAIPGYEEPYIKVPKLKEDAMSGGNSNIMPAPGYGWPAEDHGNDILPFSPSPSSRLASGSGSPAPPPAYGQSPLWQHDDDPFRPLSAYGQSFLRQHDVDPFPPLSAYGQSPLRQHDGDPFRPPLPRATNPRIAAPHPWMYEESTVGIPIRQTSFPFEPYSPAHIIVLDSIPREVSRRPPVPSRDFPRRFIGQMSTARAPFMQSEDQSKLTREEQEKVLQMLKKQMYHPTAKMLARQVSLYYRDAARDPFNLKDTDQDIDEDAKRCAVCLEDFEPRCELTVTPCGHMFHEECIVPWAKSHGQCPVCRSVFCERLRDNTPSFNATALPIDDLLFPYGRFSNGRALDERPGEGYWFG